MNGIRKQMSGFTGYGAAVAAVKTLQSSDQILRLYAMYRDDQLIQWKDSIKEVIAKYQA